MNNSNKLYKTQLPPISTEKTVLIVEDSKINRTLLKNMLSSEYAVWEAENGLEALDLLIKNKNKISAIMLDVLMPKMDGYKFLETIKQNSSYKNIPILVTTELSDNKSEKMALKLGAWDFITKPYDKEIIKFRLENAIARSELTAFNQLKYLAEYDTITGIYNKSKFFQATRHMLQNKRDEHFIFVRFDIDRFNLINYFYGNEEGDNLLRFVANFIRNFSKSKKYYTYGRIESDIFCLCIPYEKEKLQKSLKEARDTLASYRISYNIVPSFGLYIIDDINIPIDIMYDRASLAAKHRKGNYMVCYAYYDKAMSEKLVKEQEITNEMNYALKNGEFSIYLQPKYNLKTNLPSGAEALVRWIHPSKGMISPGEFIPVFEKNGFISKLDYHVWNKVCKLIRTWLDKGKAPYPISVNISRVHLYDTKFVETLICLVEKYNIPASLLHLELTESAYIDNPTIMSEAMDKLHEKGFVILMDDFGSGYSSLNVLKDINVDVLKIDMKFLSKSKIAGRGENIITSVVRMAKWLNIPVIAEGVETLEQVNFLRSIGCEFVQGYYFAKPMPINQYEELMSTQSYFKEVDVSNTVNYNYILQSSTQLDLLFSNVLQAIAIYELDGNHIEMLRVNNAYFELVGNKDTAIKSQNALMVVHPKYRLTMLSAFKEAAKNKNYSECQYMRTCHDGSIMWVHIRLKYIGKNGEKYLLAGALSDITKQKEMDGELRKYRKALSSDSKELPTMLIVDDVEINRVLLKDIFMGEYDFLEADNGETALEILKANKNKVDIILLDLIMPVMDGNEFLRLKKVVPEISSIPVVIITAETKEEQQINTLALGANDYIMKPFVEEVVKRRISNVMESNNRFREVLKEYDTILKKAETDCLTNVYNRSTCENIVNSILKTSNKYHGFLMMDIDNFKIINDTYGHENGDIVLKLVADKIKSVFRKTDIVARMGGDEFLVFVNNISATNIILKKCNYLLNKIESIKVDGINYPISLSIGVAIAPKDGSNFNDLYRNADKALYDAKNQGKNRCNFFSK